MNEKSFGFLNLYETIGPYNSTYYDKMKIEEYTDKIINERIGNSSKKAKNLSNEDKENAEELISALRELNSDDELSLQILSKLEKIIC